MTIKERISVLAKRQNTTLQKIESDLDFGRGTISRWDKSSPSVDKLQQVAQYLNVSIDFLLGNVVYDNSPDLYPYEEESETYYTDPEVSEYANKLKNNPGMRILFDAAEDMSKEDIDFVVNLIDKLKKREGK